MNNLIYLLNLDNFIFDLFLSSLFFINLYLMQLHTRVNKRDLFLDFEFAHWTYSVFWCKKPFKDQKPNSEFLGLSLSTTRLFFIRFQDKSGCNNILLRMVFLDTIDIIAMSVSGKFCVNLKFLLKTLHNIFGNMIVQNL